MQITQNGPRPWYDLEIGKRTNKPALQVRFQGLVFKLQSYAAKLFSAESDYQVFQPEIILDIEFKTVMNEADNFGD